MASNTSSISRLPRDPTAYLLPLLMVIGVAVSVAALAWSYANNSIVVYIDAAAHLLISRRVIDSLTPGAGQLGVSWLPLLHVLQLPFIWNDHMWRSGLAGGIVSTVAAWGSIFFAFRLGQDFTGSRLTGFLTGLLLITSPDLLYMQTTPMNESLFICTVLASTHFLVRWATDYRDQDLIYAGLFGLATAFNRYEGWALILAQAAIVAFISWRRGGWPMAEGLSVAYASLAGLAPLLWFAWNWALFGSPVHFLRDPFSSKSNVEYSVRQSGYPWETLHNLVADVHYYSLAVYEMMGPVLLIAAMIGGVLFIIGLVSRQERARLLPILSLLAPALFMLYALYQGSGVIWLPYLPPYTAFNVRYGLYIFPLVLGLIALLGRLPRGNLLLCAVIAAQLTFLATGGPSLLAYKEPQESETECANHDFVGSASSHCVSATGAPQYLHENYDGGLILTSSRLLFFILDTDMPLKEFIHEGNQHFWEESLKDPTPYARWIVMAGVRPEATEDLVFRALYNSQAVAENYTRVFYRQGVAIYRRNDGPAP